MGFFFHLKCPHERQCCQRKVTPADLLVHGPTVGFEKKIYTGTYMYKVARELFSLYSENTSSAGKKTNSCPMISNIETLSIRFLFVFFSFGHRWGSIIMGIRNYLYHLGLKIVFYWWVCLGTGRALIYLTVFLFKSS